MATSENKDLVCGRCGRVLRADEAVEAIVTKNGEPDSQGMVAVEVTRVQLHPGCFEIWSMNQGEGKRFASVEVYVKMPQQVGDCCDTCGQPWSLDHSALCKLLPVTRLFQYKGAPQELTYAQWMQRVNACVMHISGVDLSGVPDFDSWDMWDCEVLPIAAARVVLEDASFPFED